MKIRSLSLKMQIAMNMLFMVAMVPLAVSILITLHNSLNQMNEISMIEKTDLAKSKADVFIDASVQNYLSAASHVVLDFARQVNAADDSTLQSGEQTLAELITFISNLRIGANGGAYVFVVDADGELLFHPGGSGENVMNQEFMSRAAEIQDGYLQFEFALANQTAVENLMAWVSYEPGLELYIFSALPVTGLPRFIDASIARDSMMDLYDSNDSYIAVYDSQATVVCHPQLEIGSQLPVAEESSGDNVDLRTLLQRAQSGNSPVTGQYVGETDGSTRFARIVHEPRLDWYIVDSVDESVVFGTYYLIRRILFGVLAGAFVAMNLLIPLVFRFLLSPLAEVNRVVSLFSTGDISVQIQVKTEDEIGEIAKQINSLTQSMSEVIVRMQSDATTITNSIQDLSSSSNEISTTSNEQASAVKEIVSTMEDNDSLSKGIEKRVSEVAQISEHARDIVSRGVEYVSQSRVKMEEIRVSNNDTITGIRSLSEKIEAIWEIVNIINSIADQTKIIAFNAELEASAAGEAGKNFQIVASEIRRLANSTVSSTSEIKSKITEIQHSSDRLITASEDGTNKIQEGGALTETLHATFEEIMETSEISADSAKDISESIRQQVYAFEQILLTLKQISEGINNFVISTKSTSETTQNLKMMSDAMNEFLLRFKTSAAQ